MIEVVVVLGMKAVVNLSLPKLTWHHNPPLRSSKLEKTRGTGISDGSGGGSAVFETRGIH